MSTFHLKQTDQGTTLLKPWFIPGISLNRLVTLQYLPQQSVLLTELSVFFCTKNDSRHSPKSNSASTIYVLLVGGRQWPARSDLSQEAGTETSNPPVDRRRGNSISSCILLCSSFPCGLQPPIYLCTIPIQYVQCPTRTLQLPALSTVSIKLPL